MTASDAPRPRPTFAELARTPALRRRRVVERIMRVVLFLAAAVSVFITTAIVVLLVTESWPFFMQIPLVTFLTDTQWTPVFTDAHYGILPLLTAT